MFFYVLHILWTGYSAPSFERVVLGVAGFAGAGSLVADSVFRTMRLHGHGESPATAQFALPIFILSTAAWFMFLPSDRIPDLDRLVFGFDGKFGVQFGFLAGRFLAASPFLMAVCRFVYDGLPLAIALVYVMLPEKPESLRQSFGRCVFVAGFAGFVLYRICPAAGPGFAFPQDYPQRLPDVTAGWIRPIILPGVRLNALPSLHMTWTLLIFWYARRCGMLVGLIASVFLALTILATLGTGEHYVIDLVVAVPLAVAIEWLGLPRKRWTGAGAIAAVVSFCMVLCWLLALRFGWALRLLPAGAVSLAGLTLLIPWALRHNARAEANS